jgi:hypothetical protein
MKEDVVAVTMKAFARTNASSRSSRNERAARLDAVHSALTKYFLGSVTTTEKFWTTDNPSLGDKSPTNMVKAGKLKAVEQYVSYLVKHARSVRPKSIEKPTDDSFLVIDGIKEEVLNQMKEISPSQYVISILFPNAESYYTYAPVFRQIANRLPEIVRRLLRRHELLYARLLFAFTADLPVTFPKIKAPTQQAQRKAARKLAEFGGRLPDLGEIPRRRARRK